MDAPRLEALEVDRRNRSEPKRRFLELLLAGRVPSCMIRRVVVEEHAGVLGETGEHLMTITDVAVEPLPGGGRDGRLLACCSVTIDGEFVVHDVKVIEGRNGPFVAMPCRKLTDRCPACAAKNHLAARYCCWCRERFRVAVMAAYRDALRDEPIDHC